MIAPSHIWEHLPGLSLATVATKLRRPARSALAELFFRIGEVIAPGAASLEEEDVPGSTPRVNDAARRRVAESLSAGLDAMLDDAAKRTVSAHGAEALLLTAEIVRWLRDGGELPGKGSIELLEEHVAVFNDARHPEEHEAQRALLIVLFTLVTAQAKEIRGGRWRHLRVNIEAAEERERRRFGSNLDELRERHGLTIGELAAASQMEVLRLVGLIFATESAGASEIRLLSEALDVEPSVLIPEEMPGAPPRVASEASPLTTNPTTARAVG
ncbi:MAG: hypothetical protein JST59_10415 [Actinobacteria bacterium]|nr:hypothetical protein [Actinomycetota bacterium]